MGCLSCCGEELNTVGKNSFSSRASAWLGLSKALPKQLSPSDSASLPPDNETHERRSPSPSPSPIHAAVVSSPLPARAISIRRSIDGHMPLEDEYRVDHHVRETHHVTQAEDQEGHKMVNQYVREYTLGSGSYGKVVLYRSTENSMPYAIKTCRKSRLRKLRVAPSETALMDVMREVAIMKQLDHPNVVQLEEVIDDPESDKLYLVLHYVEGGSLFEGTGPPGGLGEDRARTYFRDIVAGLTYLHQHNIVHGDIKPENLLVDSDGHLQICDFGVSHMFSDDNDELRRSPGTPVYTAPECCIGVSYHGKIADIWALGCTLYVFLTGKYPFVANSITETYDKIVHDKLELEPQLGGDVSDLLRGLLDKDPKRRITLEDAAQHPWTTRHLGPILQLPFKGILVNDELIRTAFSKSVTR